MDEYEAMKHANAGTEHAPSATRRSRKRAITWLTALGAAACIAWVVHAAEPPAGDRTGQVAFAGTPQGQTRTRLPDGRWLYVGGKFDSAVSGTVHTVDDRPAIRRTTAAALDAQLTVPRYGHSATVLPDGSVLIAGGLDSSGTLVRSAELIDPVSGDVTVLSEPGISPRAHHAATLLTDGTVLITGGGDAVGQPQNRAEIWNPVTRVATSAEGALQIGRFDHDAKLLANGDVLIAGGHDAQSTALDTAEIYHIESGRFEGPVPISGDRVVRFIEESRAPPSVADSRPQADSITVAVDEPLAVRFTKAVQIAEIGASTITLVGPTGAVSGKVIGAEDGQLAFFTPDVDLAPGTTYTLFVHTISDDAKIPLPFTAIRFSTQAIAPASSSSPGKSATRDRGRNESSSTGVSQDGTARTARSATALGFAAQAAADARKNADAARNNEDATTDDEPEDWTPVERNRHGDWRVLGLTGDPRWVVNPSLASRKNTSAADGVTAIAGTVLRYQGRPLAGVPVSMGSRSTVTDGNGHFVLTGVPAGQATLKVDGSAVSTRGRHYTKHFIQVELAPGKTTALPAPVFLPRVDPATEVDISSPADRELVLTHPAIPGLEVRVPKGVVLREFDGKIVRRLSITPVPVDRPPYPTPVAFSVYFTLQPGGAYVDGDPRKSVRVIYPNYQGLPAGTRVNFWNYDPANGWRVYGQGTVTRDAKQVMPDQGVGFRQIMSFGYGLGTVTNPPADGPTPGSCSQGGDPVDCSTGLFMHSAVDLSVSDVLPVEVSRIYRQKDTTSRAFGIGANLSYAMSLYTSSASFLPPYVELVMADGGRIRFPAQSGSSIDDALWKNSDSPTAFQGAVLSQDTTTHQFKITLANKTTLFFAPHSPNALVGIADRNNNRISITLAGGTSGNISQVTSPNGRYIKFTYDGQGRITQAVDNDGRMVQYGYDASGRLETVTDPDNKIERYSYDSSHRMLTVTDRRNNLMVTNHYDANGRVSQQDMADGSWFFAYTLDGNGKVTQTDITDPRGYVRRDTFNSAGFITQQTFALGQPEQQTYTYQLDGRNLAQLVTDPLGRQTKLTYDGAGNLSTLTRLFGTANAVTDSWIYSSTFQQPVRYTDPLGHQTNYGYDTLGNLTSVRDALNHQATIGVDAQGMPTSMTDPLGHQRQVSYIGGDASRATDGLGNVASFFTDGLGRVQNMADSLGNTTNIAYDAVGRVAQMTDPLGNGAVYHYDGNGNLLTVLDPRALTAHVMTYDALNRMHTYTSPSGGTETFEHDALGNLSSRLDRRNQTTSYVYDPLNRLKHVAYPDGSTLDITWDAGNRATDFIDSVNGTVHRVYDGLDRLKEETSPQGHLTYGYDAAGRRQTLTVDGQSQPIVYSFDDSNRLTQVSQGGNVVGFGYDAADRRTSVTLPNGVAGIFGYDNDDQLTSITYDKGATHIADATYSYDAAGRRIGASGSLVRPLLDPVFASATHDPGNRLSTMDAASFTYDNSGNLTASSAGLPWSSLTWNARDQLTGTSRGSVFAYDALGRLTSRTAGSATTNYLYDRYNALTVNGDVMLRGLGTDELQAQSTSSGVVSHLTDAHGSSVMLTDASGAIATLHSYSAYGTSGTIGSGGGPATVDSQFQYAGADYDPTDHLYYLRNRYLAPDLSRFISEDPAGLEGGINLYSYADGDPVFYLDPYGLWAYGDPLPDWLVNGAAGFGDDLSFGITDKIRDAMGTNDVVDKCSKSYAGGEAAGMAVGLAFGGATVGRHAVANGAKSILSEARTFSTVSRRWHKAWGGGADLDHMFLPRGSGVHAGWNLVPLSPYVNRVLLNPQNFKWNNLTRIIPYGLRGAAQVGTAGLYGAVPTGIMRLPSQCGCN